MKNFRAVVVLKRPWQELWTAMRDHLPEFAGSIVDIEGIREIERTEDPEGVVHIVNEWRMRQQIPAAIRATLKIGELGWIDRNSWDARSGICAWTIEPTFFGDHIACSGETTFFPAMAGRGSRVTFAGALDLRPGLLARLGSLETTVSGLLESVVTTIIPRNLRAVVEAAAAFEPSLTDERAVVEAEPRVGEGRKP